MTLSLFEFIESVDQHLGKDFFEAIKNNPDAELAVEIVKYESIKNIVNSKDWVSISERYRGSPDIYHDYNSERINLLRKSDDLHLVFDSLKDIYRLNIHKQDNVKGKIFNEPLSEKINRYVKTGIFQIRGVIYFTASTLAFLFFKIMSGSYNFYWFSYVITALVVIMATELYAIPKFSRYKKNNCKDNIIREFMGYGLNIKQAESLYTAIETLNSHEWIFSKFKYAAYFSDSNSTFKIPREKIKEITKASNKRISHLQREVAQAKKDIRDRDKKIKQVQIDAQREYEAKYQALVDKTNDIITASNEKINSLKKEIWISENTIQERDKAITKLKDDTLISNLAIKKNEVFGLTPDCEDIDKIKYRYKQLSGIYHPDKSESDKMMKLINKAYEEYSNTLR